MTDSRHLAHCLRRLDAAMDAIGSPFVSLALPGASDAEIDRTVAAGGLDAIPAELRSWWRWHDGMDVAAVGGAEDSAELTIPAGGWIPMSVKSSFADRGDWMRMFPPGSEIPWDPSWVPFASGPQLSRLVAKLAESTPERASVGFFLMPPEPGIAPTVAGSIAEVVQTLTVAVETGFRRWHPAGGWDESGPGPARPSYAN